MPLVGTLNTMPLTDLLQWLATAGKTGSLQVERNRLRKWIQMKDGRVVGCSSDDPPQRLGQYLLSRHKITESQLREALAAQEHSAVHLGRILVDRNWLSPEDLAQHLEDKAEETIYSLFDWSDGAFRFEDGLEQRDHVFEVNIRVEDVLLRGLKRFDEMNRIRDVFPDSNMVLRYTSKPPSPEIFGDPASRTQYAAIDGDRSIAEIVLHVHGSEYQVHKFLYDLHCDGFIETAGRKDPSTPEPAGPTSPNQPTSTSSDASAPTPGAESLGAELSILDLSGELLGAGTDFGAATAVATPPTASATPVSSEPSEVGGQLESELARARTLMAQGGVEEALEVLDALYRQYPSDESLRRLTADAETEFVDHTYRHSVQPDRVPVLTRPVDQLSTEALSPHDFFMLSRIDGNWDVKSIIQIAPMREVDALRTLKRMRQMGMLELRKAD